MPRKQKISETAPNFKGINWKAFGKPWDTRKPSQMDFIFPTRNLHFSLNPTPEWPVRQKPVISYQGSNGQRKTVHRPRTVKKNMSMKQNDLSWKHDDSLISNRSFRGSPASWNRIHYQLSRIGPSVRLWIKLETREKHPMSPLALSLNGKGNQTVSKYKVRVTKENSVFPIWIK